MTLTGEPFRHAWSSDFLAASDPPRERSMTLHASSAMSRRTLACGFTLIEVMIAMALGLLVLSALCGVFNKSSQMRHEAERSGRQIENGHYAMEMLANDLKHAGYMAEFNPDVLATPASKPDPCATTIASLKQALPLQVEGYDIPSGATIPSCVSDVRAGTDIVVVRRTSNCVRGAADCDGTVAGTPYFQAALCASGTELSSASASDWYALDTANANLTKHQRNCATAAEIHRYLTHIYFIANNNASGDGMPTLKRAELGSDGAGGTSFTIVPLVEGVENLQIEYGIDTDNDGAPNVFTADPDTYSCSGSACVTNWRNVTAARVYLLVRNTEASSDYTDTKVYTLGHKADGTDNVFPASGNGYGDKFKRHVYQAEVRLNNPVGRRMVR
jgi:type IV pilus assembly protein PilW